MRNEIIEMLVRTEKDYLIYLSKLIKNKIGESSNMNLEDISSYLISTIGLIVGDANA